MSLRRETKYVFSLTSYNFFLEFKINIIFMYNKKLLQNFASNDKCNESLIIGTKSLQQKIIYRLTQKNSLVH